MSRTSFGSSSTLRTRGDEYKRSEASIVPDGTLATTSDTMRGGNPKRGKEKRGKRPYNLRYLNRPKRPLSAYNLFFRYERERLLREALSEKNGCDAHDAAASLEVGKIKSYNKTRTGKRAHRKTHGAIGFAELGKRISAAWKTLDEKSRAPFQAEADKEKERYQRQMEDMLRKPQLAPKSGNLKKPKSGYRTNLEDKNKFSSNLSEYRERGCNESIDMHEGLNAHSCHQPPDGYNYYPAAASPGQYLPPTHFDYYGYHGSEHRQAPPHQNGSSGYAPPPPYAPHFGYQELHAKQPGEGESTDNRNPHQQTAHAFSPPHPTHQYNSYGNGNNPHYLPAHCQGPHHPRKDEKWGAIMEFEPEGQQRDFAFQCEVCNKAVFSTFQECADHEAVCNGAAEFAYSVEVGGQSPSPECVRAQPISGKAEVEEQQQAVEAVMMLKKPIEC